jgi:hypothetical protein
MISACALLLSGSAWANSADFEYVLILKFQSGISFAISAQGTAQPQIPLGDIIYDTMGRPQKIGECELAYDSFSRSTKVGSIKIVYQLNRAVKIGEIPVAYDKVGRVSSIGGAAIDYNSMGNPIGLKGKSGGDSELSIAWFTKR